MVIMCCWKLPWFNQIFHCKTCSLWLQNVTTALNLWPALQQGRPSLNWVMVLSWLNRACLFCFVLFSFLVFHHKIIKRYSSDDMAVYIMDLTGDEEGSKVQKYKSPRATQQSSYLFPCFSSYKIYNFKNKEWKLSSFNVSKLTVLPCSPSAFIFLNFSESGTKDYLGKYIFVWLVLKNIQNSLRGYTFFSVFKEIYIFSGF